MSNKILVEVCVDSLEGAIVAAEAGANRLELNYALELDGLTPSAGLVEQVLSHVSVPVIAMCRPRAGDFCYTEREYQTMIADARRLKEQGVAGVAFGFVDVTGALDQERTIEFCSLYSELELVFHKAFDCVRDQHIAMDQLANLRVARIMTSGKRPSSLDGAAVIAELVDHASDRIGVLPAGGINASNAANIVRKTGVSEIHGSFSGGKPRELDSLRAEVIATTNEIAQFAKSN